MFGAICDYIIGTYRWITGTTAFDREAESNQIAIAPSPGQRAKLHHFRPVLHLRYFAATDGLITVYHKEKITPFRTKPENLGAEYYLYAPEDGDDPGDDSIERWLADHIDGPAATALQKIHSGNTLTQTDRSALAAYIGLQDMRTPLARDLILRMFQTELQAEIHSYTDDVRRVRREIWRDQGAWVRLDEIQQYVHTTEVIVPKTAWLNYLGETVNKAGRRIFEMKWHVFEAPGSYDFVTNDVGIVKGRNGFHDLRSYHMGVTAFPFWVVPLSPRVALGLAPPYVTGSFRPSNSWVGTVNKRLAHDAHRQVYSRSDAPFVARLWDAG